MWSPASLPRYVWLCGPPLVVSAALWWGYSVWIVFALYHVGWCLLLPALVNRGQRRLSWSAHGARLGLCGAGTRQGVTIGITLGAALAGGVLLSFHWGGDLLLANQRVTATLTAWGAGPERFAAVAWFMVLVNGPAEELYWRGFVQAEFPETRRGRATMPVATTAYASYHAVTLLWLLGSWTVALVCLAGVWLAGTGWAWLRQRTDSVWPAVLGHAGVVAGYMWVAAGLLGAD